MPIEPSVFHPIRTNDVQQQPIYAYKRYKLTPLTTGTGSGFHKHDAQFQPTPPPLHAQKAIYPQLLNITGNDRDHLDRRRNKGVIWGGIDARFYRYPYDPANTMELSDRRHVEKYLGPSASVLTIPYFDVGERIKKGSVTGTFDASGSYKWSMIDDGHGNLRDPSMHTSSFASSSRNILYMGFNETFRDVRIGLEFDSPHFGGHIVDKVSNISYAKGRGEKFSMFYDTINGKIKLCTGPTPTLQPFAADQLRGSGYAAKFAESASYIRIPHDDMFDRFNCCDNWTISFWYERGKNALTDGSVSKVPILSKGGIIQEEFTDELTTWQKRPVKAVRVHEHPHPGSQKASRSKTDGSRQLKTRKPTVELTKKTTKRIMTRDKNIPWPEVDGNFKGIRTPFNIGAVNYLGTTTYHIQASNGLGAMHISASSGTTTPAGTNNSLNSWQHVAVRNLNQSCSIFIDGVEIEGGGAKGTIPKAAPTANKSDLMFGRYHTYDVGFIHSTITRKGLTLDKGHYQVEGNFSVEGPLRMVPGVNIEVRGNLDVSSIGSIVMNNDCTINVYGNLNNAGTIEEPEGANLNIAFPWAQDDFGLSEFRMYDYAVTGSAIESLADRNYMSGSLYQTNVVGNCFYKNAQLVVSSPMPLYHSGSGAFHENFILKYRGTHKIYENNVLVRVPQDLCNVSMNPSATYQLATEGEQCDKNQFNTLPGEYRRHMFVSGTAFPYVTTIGLYDDDCRLLAVGKFAQPIQKRDDIDMNFIIRWDY